MSNEEKKEPKNNDLCEEKKELNTEDLVQISGGSNIGFNIEDWNGYSTSEKSPQ